MIPYELIDTADEQGTTLRLYRRDDDFSIRVDRAGELMNSRSHHSEELLAEFACAGIGRTRWPQLLVGGLGMGFTLATALACAPASARVFVAELLPAVIRWNREYLGHLAGHPLRDQRVSVLEQDVGRVMLTRPEGFDAIMLDVDNGPDAFTREGNDALYGLHGLNLAHAALKPGGLLTVWSAFPDDAFTQRMAKVGFDVEVRRVRSHRNQAGKRHTIWIGRRESGRRPFR